MSEEILVVWIDDNDENEEDANNFENIADNFRVEFKPPDDALRFLDSPSEIPDLFLVDWYLNKRSEFPGEGMTMEAKIRESIPGRPIYAFSNQADSDDINSKLEIAEDRFERLIHYDDLQTQREVVYQDILDYREIRRADREDVGEIFRLLAVPEESREELQQVLPGPFQGGIPRDSNGSAKEPLKLARWVRDKLLDRPGPINNELWIATHLGINRDAFSKYSSEFKKAKYEGIFSQSEEDAWWVSKVNSILFSKAEDMEIEGRKPRRLGPEVFDLDESEIAECQSCGQKYPETVGIDPDDGSPFPVHYSHSVIVEDEDDDDFPSDTRLIQEE